MDRISPVLKDLSQLTLSTEDCILYPKTMLFKLKLLCLLNLTTKSYGVTIQMKPHQ